MSAFSLIFLYSPHHLLQTQTQLNKSLTPTFIILSRSIYLEAAKLSAEADNKYTSAELDWRIVQAVQLRVRCVF